MINNRRNDSIVEREIARFMDEKLYSNKSLFKEFRRTDDKAEQISGSDVVLSSCDGVLDNSVVDEKVAARYANTELNSFSLELSFIDRNGNRREGWFIDKDKTTEYYLLGWVVKADIPFNEEDNRYDTDKIAYNNIRQLDWALVSKKRIMEFLEEKGWTIERLMLQDKKIRENGFVKTKDYINGVSFRYSDTYIEKPINILLKKDTYMELAHMHGTITCDGMEEKEVGNDNRIILQSEIVNDTYTQCPYKK